LKCLGVWTLKDAKEKLVLIIWKEGGSRKVILTSCTEVLFTFTWCPEELATKRKKEEKKPITESDLKYLRKRG